MSWLLFLDESGHDHKNTPYEVRGGIALHAGRLWPFVQAMKQLEEFCFGDALHRYSSETKGHRLFDKDRWRWAAQDAPLDHAARRKHCVAFLNKGIERKTPTRIEFASYGQACLLMARELFPLLRSHSGVLFAAATPRGLRKPDTPQATDYLRKDQVFLLERFFYFLEGRQEHGLLVFDETEKDQDRRLIGRIESYFTRTQPGRQRALWIVPSPLFVSSEMTYPIQAADVCIYAINWGFRLPSLGMDAPTRPEIETEFRPWLAELQFKGQGHREGKEFRAFGITYVPNPYGTGNVPEG